MQGNRGSLRLLIIEDSIDDAELLVRELTRGGFQVTYRRVDTAAGLSSALREERWDLVASDWSIPGFEALHALAIVQQFPEDLPFIIVSGTIDEEMAVQAMRAGARDFLAKQALARLVPAIERELKEKRLREERRKVEQQLLISDRMVSVGTLASGVAHEINNPLASVIANLDIALHELELKGRDDRFAFSCSHLREELRDARDAAERIRLLVSDLRLFSRPEAAPDSLVDICRILDATLRLARTEIRHRARLVKSYRPIPPVRANESRLRQALLNLVVNAAQAIREGKSEDNEIKISTYCREPNWIVLEFSDTGPGIPPEIQGHLFTPFFTTKPVGLGMGLGLSISHRIMTELGGSIEVESTVGKGTTFRVVLPAADEALLSEEAPPLTQRTPAKRRGRVLVIDDEPIVARAAQRVLSVEHDVVTCGHAKDALSQLDAGATFDAILCDVMMPLMTGMEFYEELSRRMPDQARRVVFITGGAFTDQARDFLSRPTIVSVEKPFDPFLLLALVSDIVNQRSDAYFTEQP